MKKTVSDETGKTRGRQGRALGRRRRALESSVMKKMPVNSQTSRRVISANGEAVADGSQAVGDGLWFPETRKIGYL
ncbi:hypothetical protein HanRHA438_Chr01g0015021 [Helianthus annuus]|nr:hypothetical protein HanRHA438_Chr01g0015021 [Helianthus annuus]